MREAYRKHPDSMLDADDWSTAKPTTACRPATSAAIEPQ
jgi:hypothetical protein